MSIIIQNKTQCSGCHACYHVCPKKCITMVEDTEGFLYPLVDKNHCIECGLCTQVCPIINKRETCDLVPKAYAAYVLDEEVRKKSSSGGLFYVFAEYVLKKDGAVFATSMSEDNKKAIHTKIQKKEDLEKVMGSKYLQSIVGDAFREIKNLLEEGLPVLYVGTPCQVEGLKAYLGKDYENLICMDFICHGVPSPKLWDRYLSYLENKKSAKAKRVSFRNKRFGWRFYALQIDFEKNKKYRMIHKKNSYMRLFLNNLSLRPSCYDCSSRRVDRISDITLADFWACRRVEPELDDDKGISLLMVHSPKGHAILDHVKENIFIKKVDFEKAVAGNTAMTHSLKIPEERDLFMKDMEQLSFQELSRKYVKRLPLKTRVKLLVAAFVSK